MFVISPKMLQFEQGAAGWNGPLLDLGDESSLAKIQGQLLQRFAAETFGEQKIARFEGRLLAVPSSRTCSLHAGR